MQGLIPAFITPAWQFSVFEFEQNRESWVDILDQQRKQNTSGTTHPFGNSSCTNTNLTTVPELAPLWEQVCQMAMAINMEYQMSECNVAITSAWANFFDQIGSYQREHTHKDVYTGVCFLQVPPNSSRFYLKNPGMNPLWPGLDAVNMRNNINSDRMKIDPVEGDVYIWPSYVTHGLEPHNTESCMIAIAFNITVLPKDFPMS